MSSVSNVAIELDDNSGVYPYITTDINDGETTSGALDDYEWRVPEKLGSTDIMGDNMRIRITDTTDTTTDNDASNADFEIRGKINLLTGKGKV